VSSRDFLDRWQELRHLTGRQPAPGSVAKILDFAEDGLQRFVVAELVRGGSLRERMQREQRLVPEEAVRIATRVAGALDWAHRAGITHGGIKLANVFVGDEDLVKVTDFVINQGLVADRPDLDPWVDLVGCSPERLAGLGITPASDVYSLGVLLFQMLSGRPPFPGTSPEEVARGHIRDRPPSLASMGIDAPGPVAEACELSLAKDPDARPSLASFSSLLKGTEAIEPAKITEAIEEGLEEAVVLATADQGPPIVAQRSGPPGQMLDASRRVRSPALRVIALTAIGAFVVSGIIVSVLAARSGDVTGRSPASPPRTGSSATAGIEVPDLVGLSASTARRNLLTVGLRVDELVPVTGIPGVVVRTQPPPEQAVSPGTPVILFVGVDAERLRRELEQSPSPG